MPRRMSASGSFMDLWLDRSGTELDSATHAHPGQTHPPQLRLSPDLQDAAVETVLQQAEVLSARWAA